MQPSRTLKNHTELSGVGLFSAKPITIRVSPTQNIGIRFVHKNRSIDAHIDRISSIPVHPAFEHMSPRCTSVCDAQSEFNIATIEHLMSALYALNITNAIITIESDSHHCEIPILDGSSKQYVEAFLKVGIEECDQPITPIKVQSTIRLESNGSSITINPAESPSYRYTLEYDHPAIQNATVQWNGDTQEYIDRIAQARTFSLEHEAKAMQDAGMFTHLSPKDMLVLGEDGPIDNELRDHEECALHKLLDLIGDLALVGRPLIAQVDAIKSGHAMAHQAAAAIIEIDRLD